MSKKDEPFIFRGSRRTVEETIRRSTPRSGSGFDVYINPKFPTFKPKEGENCIRIMPPSWGEGDTDVWGNYWDIAIWLHYDVGAVKARYLCRKKMKGEPCAVCEAALGAVDRDEASQFSPKEKHLCWVINRNDDKAGPQVWDMPTIVYNEINGRSKDKKTGAVILVDRVSKDSFEGYDITFTQTKTGSTPKDVKYGGVEIAREPTHLHDDEDIEARWLNYIKEHPLPDVLQFYDAIYIEKVLTGRSEPKYEELVEHETEKEVAPTRRRASRVVEEVEEEEPEEICPPSRRARTVEPEEVEDIDEPRVSTRRSTRRVVEENGEDTTEAKSEPEEDDDTTERISAQTRTRLNRLKERHTR